jgi:hypothetical protein
MRGRRKRRRSPPFHLCDFPSSSLKDEILTL